MATQSEVRVAWWKRSAVWRRITADLGALAVGGNAAYLSWGHIVETSVILHQPAGAAWLYPVSIDGMMIVGVVKAADDRANDRKVRPWARVATWLGGGLSINAQVMSALAYGWLAAAWAVVPSVTLIVVVEVQSRRGKRLPAVEIQQAEIPAVTPAVAPVESVPAEIVAEPVVTTTEPEPPEPVPAKPRRVRRPRRTGHPGTGEDRRATVDVETEYVASEAATVTAESVL